MIQDGSRKRPATSIVVRESFFIFAQLLNAPIQINRVAVPKMREFVKATCSVNLVGFKGLQACC